MFSGLSRNGPLELKLESRNLQDRKPGSCETFDATSARGSVITTAATATKTSLQTISLSYSKCLTMFPSRLCCAIWAKCPITRLVRTDLKQRERRKD